MGRKILTYSLELEDVKESKILDDLDKITEFNKTLADKYNLYTVSVLENDNLCFEGKLFSNTKSENDAKLKLLIGELKEFYKAYGLKRVAKNLLLYGNTIY